MDRHDERDKGLAVERPQQHEVFFSEGRDLELSKHDREGFDQTRRGALYLAEIDSQAPALRAESTALSQLPLQERIERIDQRTAELGAAFVRNTGLHNLGMETSFGTAPHERMLGLQVVENRVAILERRESILIVPCLGLGAPAVFDGRVDAVLFDVERALGPLTSEANFVLARVERAERLAARLRENGVAVRPFPGLTGIGDTIRITVGPSAMMEECLAALDGVLP